MRLILNERYQHQEPAHMTSDCTSWQLYILSYEKQHNNSRKTDTGELGKLCLEKKLLLENRRQHYHHQADTSALHGIPAMYTSITGLDISINLPSQHRFQLQLILPSVANYLSHVLQ